MVMPIAIDGPYEFWPKGRKFPRLSGRIGVMFGEPIAAEKLLKMNDDEAMAYLRSQVIELQNDIRARVAASNQL